jgi:hypothetical protein
MRNDAAADSIQVLLRVRIHDPGANSTHMREHSQQLQVLCSSAGMINLSPPSPLSFGRAQQNPGPGRRAATRGPPFSPSVAQHCFSSRRQAQANAE